MPTKFTLNGFRLTYSGDDIVTSVTPVAFEAVFADEQAFINYSVISAPTGELPEVDIGGPDPISVTVNGIPLPENTEDLLGFVQTAQGTHILLVFYEESTNTDYAFQIGGDPLPQFTTAAEFNAFRSSIFNTGVASGAFAPGQNILISNFSGVQIDDVAGGATITGTDGDDNLVGTSGDDLIITGNATPNGDFVTGSAGNDTINMSGNDGINGFVMLDYSPLTGPLQVTLNGATNTGSVVKAGAGTDTLIGVRNPLDAGWFEGGLEFRGTSGNDSFNVTLDNEQWLSIRGGAGTDSYTYNGGGNLRLDFLNSPGGINVNLATRQILNDGFGNVETIGGTGNVWEVQGTQAANDIFTGSAANESYRFRGGNNTVDGGGGFDRVRYDHGSVGSVNVDLAAGTAGIQMTGGATFSDSLSNIEVVRGSNGADILRGDGADNRLEGRSGDDLMDGRAGNDTLFGQDGNDTLLGGAGNDFLDGGAGNDRIEVGTSTFGGGDTVIGSAGNDVIDYGGVAESGGGWNDLVYAFHSSPIGVNINGNTNTGSVSSSIGSDTLVNIQRAVANTTDGFSLFGSGGNDSFTVDGGAESWMQIFGGRGSDNYALTLSGVIRLNFSGNWNEWNGATQGLQINLAAGQIANDGFGNFETISVTGGDQRLEIHGTRHADSMTGSARSELFITGGGNDTIDGGDGFDWIRYDRGDATAGVNVNLITGVATGATNGVNFTQTLLNIEAARGTNFDDVIQGGNQDGILRGFGGNDRLFGGLANDTLEGGDGADTISGGGGDDFIYGGSSNADLRDVIFGGDGNDYIDGGWGNDDLNGGNGNDTVMGDFGSDTLIGNAGDDLIAGGAGSDLMFGGPGNDTLNGGFGYDRMNGGTGADRFFHQGVADHASDWIQDYNAAEGDLLVFGLAGATRAQFQINVNTTPGAGSGDVAEAFVIYRPTGQIMWALVDGTAQDQINILVGGQIYDLLA